jgi:hypothetical protein
MAVAQHESRFNETDSPLPDRGEILARYRRLREISQAHHHAILKFTSPDLVMRQARRLGLFQGKMLVLEDMDELHYACDLAIHTAPAPGRSRAIDRYANSVKLVPGSDEAIVLDAMRSARFSLLAIERRHETAGVIATDLVRNAEIWLIDLGLESSVPDGAAMATRLFTPDKFSMTTGICVPFEPQVLHDIKAELPRSLADVSMTRLIDDPRFAEVIYGVALASGILDRVEYRDVSAA